MTINVPLIRFVKMEETHVKWLISLMMVQLYETLEDVRVEQRRVLKELLEHVKLFL